MSSSPSTADCVELFQSIGLSESKAKETAKNQTVSDSLVFLITKVPEAKGFLTPTTIVCVPFVWGGGGMGGRGSGVFVCQC